MLSLESIFFTSSGFGCLWEHVLWSCAAHSWNNTALVNSKNIDVLNSAIVEEAEEDFLYRAGTTSVMSRLFALGSHAPWRRRRQRYNKITLMDAVWCVHLVFFPDPHVMHICCRPSMPEQSATRSALLWSSAHHPQQTTKAQLATCTLSLLYPLVPTAALHCACTRVSTS
jgi:hypothetical protein